jgi:hypothetical protein
MWLWKDHEIKYGRVLTYIYIYIYIYAGARNFNENSEVRVHPEN